MKRKWIFVVIMSVVTGSAMAADAAETSGPSDIDKLSYSMGSDLGKNMLQQGVSINPDALAKGTSDGLSNTKPLLSDEEMGSILEKFGSIGKKNDN